MQGLALQPLVLHALVLHALVLRALMLHRCLGGGIVQPVEVVMVIHAVESIAGNGMTDGCHVDAQLVGAAGFGC